MEGGVGMSQTCAAGQASVSIMMLLLLTHRLRSTCLPLLVQRRGRWISEKVRAYKGPGLKRLTCSRKTSLTNSPMLTVRPSPSGLGLISCSFLSAQVMDEGLGRMA